MLGAPRTAADPMQTRVAKAKRSLDAIVEMAVSGDAEYGVHAAFVLIQRTSCPALDYDMRVRTGPPMWEAARSLGEAVDSALARILRTELSQEQLDTAHRPPDLAGMALRNPGRKGAPSICRWAALSEAMLAVRRWAQSAGYDANLEPAGAELTQAQGVIWSHGVDVRAQCPHRSNEASALVEESSPAAAAAARDAATCGPQRGRQRLQARVGRMTEVNDATLAWPQLEPAARKRLADLAGQGSGTLFGDHSRGPGSGWLQDYHFTHKALTMMGIPTLLPHQRCGLRRKTGSRKGQACEAALSIHGRHLTPCHAGLQTRVHNSLVRRLARCCEEAGLGADVEAVQPWLHQRRGDGSTLEARMDVVVSRPGGIQAYPVDVRTLDAEADGCTDMEGRCKQRSARSSSATAGECGQWCASCEARSAPWAGRCWRMWRPRRCKPALQDRRRASW